MEYRERGKRRMEFNAEDRQALYNVWMLVALENVERGNWFKRLFDSIKRLFSSLF